MPRGARLDQVSIPNLYIRGVNPFLPSHEFIPDGEPHVFGDRVYLYGSHDRLRGHAYCLGDYVCYSAPVTDLMSWRFEGVIYGRTDDPANGPATADNPDALGGAACLYAPDVTRGPDGKYYLYYALDKLDYISVAVCDTPAGRFEYLGFVRHSDGTPWGRASGDMPCFDPAVLTEGDVTYLYSGFSAPDDTTRIGCTAVALSPDMLTITDGPHHVLPSASYAAGTEFEGFAFFEAPSIRRVGALYYLVYSTQQCHELAYATSTTPLGGFEFRGVIVSNADIGIRDYKPADAKMAPGGNNHGGFELTDGQYVMFFHRHTGGHEFSRQAMLEPISISDDGTIAQVPVTSHGPLTVATGGVLPGTGRFGAWIACHLFIGDPAITPKTTFPKHDPFLPFITWAGADVDAGRARPLADSGEFKEDVDERSEKHVDVTAKPNLRAPVGYVSNIFDRGGIGFRFFDLAGGPTRVTIWTRGYLTGGRFEVRLVPFGPAVGEIVVDNTNEWTPSAAVIDLPAGKHGLYLVYRGGAMAELHSIELSLA